MTQIKIPEIYIPDIQIPEVYVPQVSLPGYEPIVYTFKGSYPGNDTCGT